MCVCARLVPRRCALKYSRLRAAPSISMWQRRRRTARATVMFRSRHHPPPASMPHWSPHSFTFGPRGGVWREDLQQLWMQVPLSGYDPRSGSLSQLARADLWLHRWTGIADALLVFRGTPRGRVLRDALDTKLHLCSMRFDDSESERAAIAFVREQLIVHDNGEQEVASRGAFNPRPGEWDLHISRNDPLIFTGQTLPAQPSTLELADLWLHRWTAIADALLYCSQTSGVYAQKRLYLKSERVREDNQLKVVQYIEEQLRLHHHDDEISPAPRSEQIAPRQLPDHDDVMAQYYASAVQDPPPQRRADPPPRRRKGWW
jgi:hypothetical protein